MVEADLGTLIVRLKSKGAKETLASIDDVDESLRKTEKTSKSSTKEMDKNLNKWGVAFKAIGASAVGVLGTIIASGPIAQRFIKEIFNIFGQMSDLIFTGLGLDVFLADSIEGMATFIDLWTEKGLLAAIKDIITVIGGGLIDAIVGIPKLTVGLLFEGGEALKEKISGIWDTIKTTAGQKWDEIKTFLTLKAQGLRDGIIGRFSNLFTSLNTIWRGIMRAAGRWWDKIKTFLTTKAKAVRDAILPIIRTIIDFIQKAINKLLELFGLGGIGIRAPSLPAGGGTPTGPLGGAGPIGPLVFPGAIGLGESVTFNNTIVLDGRVIGNAMATNAGNTIRRQGGRAV